MTPTAQRDLFARPDAPPEPAAGLFAEIVFDRPLDHAYTYAVPDALRVALAVGKRVRAPFGKGDKATVGYCVGLRERAPGRTVKELLAVLDEESLLTPDLMRLTRWMADYYLCGWGQVLNVVVPAGAREQAGTRSAVFLEAVPEAELPQPSPALTSKQSAALEQLRGAGKPMEMRQLARQVRCGSGPLEALVEKGYARRVVRRIDRFTDTTEEPGVAEGPITLNADQLRAWAPIEQRLRQGGFQAFLLHGVT